VKTIKEIPFNDIFSSAVEVYVDHLRVFVRLAGTGAIPAFVIETLSKSSNPGVSALAVLFLPVAIGMLFFFALAVLGAVSLFAKGKEVVLSDVLAGVWERFARLVGAFFLVGLLLISGAVLLILPFFYAAVVCTFVFFAILMENKGIIDAFKRSFELTEGVFWKMLGAHTVMLLVAFVVFFPMNIAFNWIGVPTVIASFFRYAAGVFLFPLIIAFYYFLFVNLKEQKDGDMKISVYANNKA
jgi:hypothetical protein